MPFNIDLDDTLNKPSSKRIALDKDVISAVGASLFIYGVLIMFMGALIAAAYDWGANGLVDVEIFAIDLATIGGGFYEYGHKAKQAKKRPTPLT